MEDILIVGGGIIGTLIAFQCSKYHLNVTLIDKENDIANATTMANSAIIHAGYDPDDYTLKAEMNIKGAKKYAALCRELKVDYKQIGSLVVATNDEEVQILKQLQKKATKRGIYTKLLSQFETRLLEENISDQVIASLKCSQTAIVTPWLVAIAAIETAMANQCKCELNQEVIAIEKKENFFIVKTKEKEYQAKMVINCAGLHADDINEMVTGSKDFEIIPRKGEYFVLSKNCKNYVKHVIYPTPCATGKGVLVVPTVHGNVLLGPTAMNQEDKNDRSTSQEGLDFVRDHISKIVKDVPYGEIIHSFSGLRPTSDRHDFIIEESKVKGFINVAGMESPGLASAPAIAEKVVHDFVIPKFNPGKRMFFAHRSVPVQFDQCSEFEKQELVLKDKRFGNMICRCEQVSEAEIVNCIRRKCGARSVMAVKKRVRPGMGKCQGGFCEPLVVKILARELNISPLEVDYNSKNSAILVSESKVGKS